MATDLKPHERQIDQLIDEAIDCVAGNVLASEGLHPESSVGQRRYLEIYADIQSYIGNKINEDFRKRRVQKLVNQVDGKIQRYLEPDCNKESGFMMFSWDAEADKACEIFHKMGYDASWKLDHDGFKIVEYRQKPILTSEIDK